MLDQEIQEISRIIMTLNNRCQAGNTCEEIMKCLKSEDWDSVIHCCTVRLQGYEGSSNTNGKALLNAQLGTAYLMKGQPDWALPHYREAASLFSVSDCASAGLVFMLLGRTYEHLGNLNKASQSYRQSIELLSDARDPLAGKAIAWRSRLVTPVKYASQANRTIFSTPGANAAPSSSQGNEDLEEGRAQQKIGHVYRHAGEWQQAIKAYEQAAALFEKHSEVYGAAICYESAGDMYQLDRQWTQAKQAYEKALRFFQRMEDYAAVDKVMDKLHGVIRLERAFKTTHPQGDSRATQDATSRYAASRYQDTKRAEEQARARKAQEKQATEDTVPQPDAEKATKEAPTRISQAVEQPAATEDHPPKTTEAEVEADSTQIAQPSLTELPPDASITSQEVAQEQVESVQGSVAQDTPEQVQVPTTGQHQPGVTTIVEGSVETVRVAEQVAVKQPSEEVGGGEKAIGERLEALAEQGAEQSVTKLSLEGLSMPQETAEEQTEPVQSTLAPKASARTHREISTGGETDSEVVETEVGLPVSETQRNMQAFLERAVKAKGVTGSKLPSASLELALLPVSKDRVAAGKPIVPLGRNASYITVTTLHINGVDFYLRDIFSGGGEPRIDSFNFAVLVEGSSMEPTIHNGDCVLIRKVEASEGDIVVVRVSESSEEDRLTLKRYYPAEDHVLLLPDNNSADVIAIAETEALIETVKGYYQKFVESDRLHVMVGSQSLVEGKVAAVLSPV